MPFSNRRRAAPVGAQPESGDFLTQASELIPAEVRMISGCHSVQTSADVSNVSSISSLPNPAGRAGGACTSALLDILHTVSREQSYLTFQDLLLKLRDELADSGFSQVPQLTSSRPLDVQSTPFHLVGGTGRRRAVLVGINYCGQNGELSGCHNDVFNMKKYLMAVHGFPESDITVLVDDRYHAYPTRGKIIAELKRLVRLSVPGDSVYFHYSGHGGLLDPEFNIFKGNNSEYDETIYPVDHESSGHIRDFNLFNHFVKPMAANVTVTCVMDCCHSGSVLDLPYSFQPTDGGEVRMRENVDFLSNLAFLYVLAGGVLSPAFEGLSEHIGHTIGGALDSFQGLGIEAAAADEADFEFPEGDDGVIEDIVQGAFEDGGEEEAYALSRGAVDYDVAAAMEDVGDAVAFAPLDDDAADLAVGALDQGFEGVNEGDGDEECGEVISDCCGCIGDNVRSLFEEEEE